MSLKLLDDLYNKIDKFRGFGPKNLILFEKLCGDRLLDIIFHLPSSLIKRLKIKDLKNEYLFKRVIVNGKINKTWFSNKAPKISIVSIEVNNQKLEIIYFNVNKNWFSNNFIINNNIIISGELTKKGNKYQIIHPDIIQKKDSEEIIPIYETTYPLTAGLSHKKIKTAIKYSIESVPEFSEWINKDLLKSYNWYSFNQSLYKLHFPKNKEEIDNNNLYRERLAYDEALSRQLALNLIRKHKQKIEQSILTNNDTLKNILLNKLPFELTEDQKAVLKSIYKDINSSKRMYRLLQGDVGSGKTVVAFLSLIHVIENGFQGALMAPTEILAYQHYVFFKKYENILGIKIALLTSKLQKNIKSNNIIDISKGKINLVIGTHAIIQSNIKFKNLRLAIIDEQHRFGVYQRLELSKKSPNTDFMVMTATPIPRTLVLTDYGDMDISIIHTKPKNRPKINTISVSIPRMREVIKAISRAVENNEQIFWVCPLVNDSEKLDLAAAETRQTYLNKFFPDNVALVHGKMDSKQKEEALLKFSKNKKNILVSTTVIEVGIDIPNATIMIIEHAERFGLAQLHQLRGRIGRGNKKSVCILLYDQKIGDIARERLKVMRETNNGFLISEKDLKLRGAGEILGTKQSGGQMFKVLDISKHENLITIANQNSKLIINKNPNLLGSEGKKIKNLLNLFGQDKAIKLIKSG
ncbi:MAG: ATP-dependent DNA helicase RecG [Pelagibacterales bacterium]|nr:ATP-dependent DNA helicase RecG [Pelagibacterales bacterium]PPR16205.1 MAG: ATP-dependent DNA helicase RecG [Alphaproteobacteria bacterium MarineAlpha9_Bin3]|tara:strand:+ start:11765 stop:13846 length:2082 start_codon:yes stop_codon:yes gene_type:complete